MSERDCSVLVKPSVHLGPRQPDETVLSAISDLADHARAYSLDQVDSVLTELLAFLYSEQTTATSLEPSPLV